MTEGRWRRATGGWRKLPRAGAFPPRRRAFPPRGAIPLDPRGEVSGGDARGGGGVLAWKRWVAGLLFALSAGVLPAQAETDSASGTGIESKPSAGPIEKSPEDPPVRAAIDRGLQFLRRNQQQSGAIGDSYEVAVTSLAGLAILGAGYPYRQGPPHAREALEGALAFLANSARSDGYLSDAKSRMHGHCYAMLFLTQLYGELPLE